MRLLDLRFVHRHTRTRFPFHYGIASMTDVPHVMLEVTAEVNGRVQRGWSAEGLPPKWFTKDPATTFNEDLPGMLEVIRHAADTGLAARGVSFFDWWHQLYAGQSAWADENDVPPLLANLGTALVERAALDAFCRVCEAPLHVLLRGNAMGIDLASVRSELAGLSPADVLPVHPVPSLIVRHTVGLADPLLESEITDPLLDGLPQSLEACVRSGGLTHYKIKLAGKLERDLPRLRNLAGITGSCRFTLDGNENFPDIRTFRSHWDEYQRDPVASAFLRSGLIFVEQPLHRLTALDDSVKTELAAWSDHPQLIIDEADASLDDLPLALSLGYTGTSHKNCKGIIKGLANLALLRRRLGPDGVLSGEDLCNVGYALLQDCAVQSSFGVTHAERNGHHYFRGLGMFPAAISAQIAADHGDLYADRAGEFPAVHIEHGHIGIGSLLAAPLGAAFEPDLAGWTAGLPEGTGPDAP